MKKLPKDDKKLVIQAVQYSPRIHNESYRAFGVNLYELVANCKLVANCYSNSQKEYRYYTHEDLVTLFPAYEGYINTKLSLLLGEGFEADGDTPKKEEANQEILEDLLQSQTRAGTLNQEELYAWIREFIERKTAILFVDENGFEKLDTQKAEVVELSVEDSVSWNTDIAGILYFTKGRISNVPTSLKIKYATDGVIQKIGEYPDTWYIPKENLVVLGKYSNICHELSIFDTDRARIQYVVEANRLGVDELSRDKIPPIILKMKALSPRDRAIALGVNPALADTPEGVEEFQKQLTIKYGLSKEAISKYLLTDPQQGKVSILDMAVYEDLMPLPTNGSYQEDMTRSEDMGLKVMSNLLNLPTAILGSKTDNFATAIKPLLQFTQNTLIKKEQEYLNIKLNELSEKFGFNFTFEIEACDFIDEESEANVDKIWIDSARQLVGFGTPVEDVNSWLQEKIEIDIKINDTKERFTDSSLVPFVDASLTQDTVEPIQPVEDTAPIEDIPVQQKKTRKKSGIEKTIV